MNDDAPLSTSEGIRPHTTRAEREYSSDDDKLPDIASVCEQLLTALGAQP